MNLLIFKGVPPPHSHFSVILILNFFWGVYQVRHMWKPRGRKNFGSKCAKLCWMWAKNKVKTGISVLTIAQAHELGLTWEFLHVLRHVQNYGTTFFVFEKLTVKMRKNAHERIWWHYLKTIKCANARMKAFSYS